jgi:hypothetical protein
MFPAVENLLAAIRRKFSDFPLKGLIQRTGSNQEVYFDEPARPDLFRAEALNAVIAKHLEQLIFLIEIHRHPRTDIGLRFHPMMPLPRLAFNYTVL